MYRDSSDSGASVVFYGIAIFSVVLATFLSVAGCIYHFGKHNMQAFFFFLFLVLMFIYATYHFIKKVRSLRKGRDTASYRMSDKVVLDKKNGLLMPNKTIYGKIMAGHYMIPIIIVVAGVMLLVPWEVLYHVKWFSGFVKNMSVVSINLTEIPTTQNPFPKYSIAFLSFINLVGPIYMLIGFYFGLRHYENTKVKITETADIHFSSIKLIGGALFFVMMILTFLWGTYYFTGVSTIFPGLFYQSEWQFVLFFTLLWVLCSLSAFLFMATLLVLINRYR